MSGESQRQRESVWQDPQYLRREQYADGANLGARIALHSRFSTNPQSWHGWLLAQIDPARFETVLDVGCGTGSLWVEEALSIPATLSPVLSDLSAGMLEEASSRLAPRGERFRFVQCSAGQLPFESASFEAVMANHMLYHAPDLSLAITELCRVLRPGGWLFASTNGPMALREIEALLQQARPGAEFFSSIFGLHNGPAALRPHLSDVGVTRYPNRLEVTEPEPLVDYIASTEGGRDLSESERQVVHRLVQEEIATRGHFTVTIDVGLIAGRRVARS